MKKILILFLAISTMNTFASSSIELDQIDLNGNLPRRAIENKLLSRRRKLEEQTIKKLLKRMEVERIKNELKLSQQFENALEKTSFGAEVE